MRRSAVLGTGALVLVLLFWKLRLSDPVVGFQFDSLDYFSQIYPMWLRAGEWMRAGNLPLWNPYQGCGHPFLASLLYGVLYPPNLTRLFLPAEVALEVNIIVHLWLGTVFMYLYARNIGLGTIGASTAAIAYGFSGGLARPTVWFTAIVAAMVWLPLGLAAIEGIAAGDGRRRRLWTAVLAIAVAMPLFAGWAQAWVFNLYVMGFYAAARAAAVLRRQRAPAALHFLSFVALGTGLGLALTAAQLLPSVELQALGPRQPGGLTLTQMMPWGPEAPAEILAATIDGRPAVPRPTYQGIAVLLLLPLAFVVRAQRGRAALLAAFALVGLLVSFTVHTPVFRAYLWLPTMSWFRMPGRSLWVYTFAMAALAGIAIDAVAAGPAQRRRLAVPAAIAATALLLWLTPLPELTQLHLAAAAGLLLVAAVARTPRVRSSSLILVTVLLLADLFTAAEVKALRPYHDLRPLTGEQPLFQYIRAHQGLDRTYLLDALSWHPHMLHKHGTLFEVYVISDYEVLSLERTGEFFRAVAGRGRVPGAGHPFSGSLAVDHDRLKHLGLLSVRFAVLPVGHLHAMVLAQLGWRAAPSVPSKRYVVFENPRPVPRAYVAFDALAADDKDSALAALLRDSFDPWHSVVLEAEDGARPAAQASAMPIQPASIVTYEPTRVAIEVTAPQAGYLVLTDTWYPGWRAEVDGNAVPILRANYLFRAVALPPGAHRVTFAYVPMSFRAGVVISLLALAGVLALVFHSRSP